MNFNHTQKGYLIIYVLLAVVLLFASILMLDDYESYTPLLMTVIIFILASFSTLNTNIDENYLRIKFGYGIYSKRFLLKSIVSAEAVKNPWYYGWGIRVRLWPRMVIFNVSGFDAVEINMEDGKTYRIGTDVPKELENAIKKAIK
jgi:hypothetical protein